MAEIGLVTVAFGICQTTSLLSAVDPQGNDPISGTRDWGPGDCGCCPGSKVIVTAGHHRTAEIARRVMTGEMDPETLIEFVISPP